MHGKIIDIKTVSLLACFAAMGVSCNGMVDTPNIVFILADDLSYKDLGYTGQTMIATPNIDRLAAGGMRFRQAYSGAAECAPSRASLMTGMHMGHCRIRCNESARGGQDYLLKSDFTVAEMLKKAGYATGMVGKWGIALPNTEGVPYKKGFDYSFGFYDQLRAHTYYPNYLMENEKAIPLPQNYGFDVAREWKAVKHGEYNNHYDDQGRLVPYGVPDPGKATNSQMLIHQAGLDFIRRNKDKPFFLYYAPQLPHGPVIAPELGAYAGRDWDLHHKEWAAMVAWLDVCVGDIVNLVKELGLEKNTVVFFASDNGYSEWIYLGRKAWDDDPLFKNKGPWPGGKFALYEGGCRIPLCVSWPGHIPARDSDHLCALYDFMATAADLTGIARPENDGISFMPELLGNAEAQPKHDYLYWENGTRSPQAQAARFGPWYAMRTAPGESIHLFNVVNDPACMQDCTADHPDLIEKAQAVFAEAHVDSIWFRNPQESQESYELKQERARQEGGLQVSVHGNTLKRPPQ